ncbi:MAG TPA: type II toxin-antitoxin system PemK/MazF family toxin [Coriobacteriia bacterium]
MVDRPKRGEVYWVDLDPVVGSEQGGRRPAVVVQNDLGNRFSPTTIVVPLSSRIPTKPYPFHVWLEPASMPKPSVVKCNQVRNVDKSRLHPGRIAALDDETMARVDEALRISLGMD